MAQTHGGIAVGLILGALVGWTALSRAALAQAQLTGVAAKKTLAVAETPPSHASLPPGLLPAGTLVRVKMLHALDSLVNRPGDQWVYEVTDSVHVGNTVVIRKGCRGLGTLHLSEEAGRGKKRPLDISFGVIQLGGDEEQLPVGLTSDALAYNHQLQLHASEAINLFAKEGPAGVVFDGVVPGTPIYIPEESELYVATLTNYPPTPVAGAVTQTQIVTPPQGD
jgi:hypothetical protein